MRYSECQEWVQDVIDSYERLLSEILELSTLEEVKRRIKEFRGEEEGDEAVPSGRSLQVDTR